MLGALALSLKGMPPFPQRLWIVSLAVWVVGVSSLTWEMRKTNLVFLRPFDGAMRSISEIHRDVNSFARSRLARLPISARVHGTRPFRAQTGGRFLLN